MLLIHISLAIGIWAGFLWQQSSLATKKEEAAQREQDIQALMNHKDYGKARWNRYLRAGNKTMNLFYYPEKQALLVKAWGKDDYWQVIYLNEGEL